MIISTISKELDNIRSGRVTAYLWTHPGAGQLEKIDGVSAECWIRTGYHSYCGCWSDTVYIFSTDAERQATEQRLQNELARTRAEWSANL